MAEYNNDKVEQEFEKAESCTHQSYTNKDGTIHYEGVLGKFDYDPTQFELQQTLVASEGEDASYVEILRYIGAETDGSKIQIPKGIENTLMMFMGTEITSPPKVPDSVKYADAMFMSCMKLKTAPELGKNVESASFFCANCKHIVTGPKCVPGKCKNASFMFYGCESMTTTPVIQNGVKGGDFMFGNCVSMTTPPVIPSSMDAYDGFTVNCPGVEATLAAENRSALEGQRKAYAKYLDKPTLSQRISSAFGALLQVHALRQMGYGIIKAPLMVHSMRKNGQMGRDFASGLSALAMTRSKGGLVTRIARKATEQSQKKKVSRAEYVHKELSRYDRAMEFGTGRVTDVNAITVAGKDAKRGLFMKANRMSFNETAAYRERYCGTIRFREEMMDKIAASKDGANARVKKQLADWFETELSAASSYYREGRMIIENGDMYKTADAKHSASEGLDKLSMMQTQELVEAMHRMQEKHHIFSEEQMRRFDKMTRNMPCGKQCPEFGPKFCTADIVKNAAYSGMQDLADRFGSVVRQEEASEQSEDEEMCIM